MHVHSKRRRKPTRTSSSNAPAHTREKTPACPLVRSARANVKYGSRWKGPVGALIQEEIFEGANARHGSGPASSERNGAGPNRRIKARLSAWRTRPWITRPSACRDPLAILNTNIRSMHRARAKTGSRCLSQHLAASTWRALSASRLHPRVNACFLQNRRSLIANAARRGRAPRWRRTFINGLRTAGAARQICLRCHIGMSAKHAKIRSYASNRP